MASQYRVKYEDPESIGEESQAVSYNMEFNAAHKLAATLQAQDFRETGMKDPLYAVLPVIQGEATILSHELEEMPPNEVMQLLEADCISEADIPDTLWNSLGAARAEYLAACKGE